MDNIPSYIARKHGEEDPDYLHPMLESSLKETFGANESTKKLTFSELFTLPKLSFA